MLLEAKQSRPPQHKAAAAVGSLRSVTIRGSVFPVIRKEDAAALVTAASNSEPSDSALVMRVRTGDEEAMTQLYDRYSQVVYSTALRVLGETAGAEDVLQDVFMQLWRRPGLFDASRGSLPAWLAVIARNRALDVLRKRKPQTDVEDVVLSVPPELSAAAEWGNALDKVRSVLATMAAPQRLALDMAFFQGLTHSEIAARTGEPLGTIKTRIRTALLNLRKAFQP